MLKVKKIEVFRDDNISKPDRPIYTVMVNDKVFLECLGEEEVRELTYSEIEKLWEEFHEDGIKDDKVVLELNVRQFNLLGMVFAEHYEEHSPAEPSVNDRPEVFKKKFSKYKSYGKLVIDVLSILADAQKELEGRT